MCELQELEARTRQGIVWLVRSRPDQSLINLLPFGNIGSDTRPGPQHTCFHRNLCRVRALPGSRVPDKNSAVWRRYYQMLGTSIERDRDFEELLRHHWGFAEAPASALLSVRPQMVGHLRARSHSCWKICVVNSQWSAPCALCIILELQLRQPPEVGLAYAFRKHLEHRP